MIERVRSGEVELAVGEWGDPARPTVVLVHGYPDTSGVWVPVAERLAPRYHVVAYDVRGAGASTAPRRTSGYRLDHLVADLAAVADATSPGRPVHLVGHDWGSIQGWEAVTTPALARHFASFTSISGPCLDHVGHWWRRRLLRPSPRALGQVATQLRRSWYVGVFQLPVLAPMAWRLGLARAWPGILARLEGVEPEGGYPAPTVAADGRRGVALYRANIPSRLREAGERRTEVPVQIVVPAEDRYVTPALLDGVEAWAARLWRRPVPAGHWVVRTHPDLVARAIGEMVDHAEGGPEPPGLRRARVGSDRQPFDGYLVVVTGAGGGIGRATSLAFAEQGAVVVAADVDAEAAVRTAELARLVGGTAEAVHLDVGDAEAMEAFAKRVHHDLGVPDVVVNNAGVGLAGPLLETTVEDWERLMAPNLWGVIHGCRLFGRQMAERGEGGHIVNVASAAAFAPSRSYPAYAATKAAVLMLSECLRAELTGTGIGVSAVCPGMVNTGIVTATRFVGTSDADQERRRDAVARLYRSRGLTPDRVAEAVVRAVRDDEPVLVVGAEARAARLLSRVSPGLARRLARIDLIEAMGRR